MNRAELFDQLMHVAAQNQAAFREKALTAFWPMCGRNWNGQLMVIGRAVNGWTDPWLPAKALEPGGRSEILAMTLRAAEGDGVECPMLWVSKGWGAPSGYNTKRSAFWRVIRSTVTQLGVCDTDLPSWPSSLMWTNLYKLSPAAGSNPSAGLTRIQEELSPQLLALEVVEYQPDRILFLTGMDWAEPFLSRIGEFEPCWTGLASAQTAGTIRVGSNGRAVRVVVAMHPQGKRHDAFVAAVQDAWRAVDSHSACCSGKAAARR